VPFLSEGKLCYHVVEVARTWPYQPAVELSYCYSSRPKSQKVAEELLRKAVREHFVNPPPHTEARRKRGLPRRQPVDEEGPFNAKFLKVPYDLDDYYNPSTPVWTLEKGKFACPQGVCRPHKVTDFIQIDQSKVDPKDPDTFTNTEIIVDYSGTQAFQCVQRCRKENCRVNGASAKGDVVVTWPKLRATCSQSAVLRSHLVNPSFSCRKQCESNFRGQYQVKGESPMSCSPASGEVLKHKVHLPSGDAEPVENRTLHK
jgi:hypothetical protein